MIRHQTGVTDERMSRGLTIRLGDGQLLLDGSVGDLELGKGLFDTVQLLDSLIQAHAECKVSLGSGQIDHRKSATTQTVKEGSRSPHPSPKLAPLRIWSSSACKTRFFLWAPR